MTPPEPNASPSPPLHPRAANVLTRKPLSVPRAARIIASVTVAVTILAAVLIHFTDKKNFPNIGDSLWWAIQTVTTVGYGDLTPTSAAGRLVAALVMLVGIGFLTIITAAITSTFIETARRRIEGTTTDAISAKLDQIGARLEMIEAGLTAAGATTAINRDEASAGES
jgi:voltage-gated potassium channel